MWFNWRVFRKAEAKISEEYKICVSVYLSLQCLWCNWLVLKIKFKTNESIDNSKIVLWAIKECSNVIIKRKLMWKYWSANLKSNKIKFDRFNLKNHQTFQEIVTVDSAQEKTICVINAFDVKFLVNIW